MIETDTSKRIQKEIEDLIKRIEQMNSTTLCYFDYLSKTQELNQSVSKNMRNGLV